MAEEQAIKAKLRAVELEHMTWPSILNTPEMKDKVDRIWQLHGLGCMGSSSAR